MTGDRQRFSGGNEVQAYVSRSQSGQQGGHMQKGTGLREVGSVYAVTQPQDNKGFYWESSREKEAL